VTPAIFVICVQGQIDTLVFILQHIGKTVIVILIGRENNRSVEDKILEYGLGICLKKV